MMTIEEFKKACETLIEVWNKVLETMKKLAKA